MFDVKVNGWTYRAGSDPIDPSDCPPMGQVINASTVVAGRLNARHVLRGTGPGPGFAYSFGNGNPSGAKPLTVLGGLGPIIIGGLKYGNGNLYKPGTTGGPSTGDPGPTYASSLIQRNNNTYISLSKHGATVGKGVIAHNAAKKKLLVLIQPISMNTGITLDNLRDKLFGVGVENAVFLDGSDSVCFYNQAIWLAFPGENKNRVDPGGPGVPPLIRPAPDRPFR